MNDPAFQSREELWAEHDRRIARQELVEAKAQELREAMTMVDFEDAVVSMWNHGREGEAFVRELMALAKTDDSDDAELGRLIKYALRKYFLSAADMEVEL